MTIDDLDGHINNLSVRVPCRCALELGFVDGLMYEDELHALLARKRGGTEDEDEPSQALAHAGYGQYHNPDVFRRPDSSRPFKSDLGGGEQDDARGRRGRRGRQTVPMAQPALWPWCLPLARIESGAGDDATIGSDRIAGALREARLDPEVGAVVLRVNSPGGQRLGQRCDLEGNRLAQGSRQAPGGFHE